MYKHVQPFPVVLHGHVISIIMGKKISSELSCKLNKNTLLRIDDFTITLDALVLYPK